MAEEIHRQIRLVRCKLGEFIRWKTDFSRIENSLKDSESFLSLQISEYGDEFKKVKELHDHITLTVDENDEVYVQYKNDNIFHSIQDIYFKHSSTLQELIKIINNSERHDLTFSEFSHAAFAKSEGNSSGMADFHIPFLSTITPFDGSYEKWPEFRDDFVCNVHDNKHFNSAAKMKTLKLLLKGDAAVLIKRDFGNVKASDYDEVWKKLNKRYNHKRILVYSYMQVLVFQPVLEKESSSGLKKIYDTTLDSLLDLRKLGLPVDGWGDLIIFLVHAKLPLKTKELWDERLSRSDALPSLNKFLDFLESRFRTLESLETTRKLQNVGFNSKKVEKSDVKKISTFQTSTKHSKKGAIPKANMSHKQPSVDNTKQTGSENSKQTSSDSQRPTNCCRVCKENNLHSLRHCKQFLQMKPEERKTLITTFGYCFNCFSFSHKVTECTSEGRCSYCGQTHHSLLHIPRTSPPNGTQNEVARDIPSTADGRFSSVNTLLSEHDSDIIFPTALVRVSNAEGHSIILRALIDACSDVSYITREAAQKLNLSCFESMIQVKGVGDALTTESRNVTSFDMHSLVDINFTTKVTAYVLPKISSNRPIRNFKVLFNNDNLTALADPHYNKKSKIDLLLGGGIESIIKLGRLIKSEFENINFQETHLGWIVSGSIHSSQCMMLEAEYQRNVTTDCFLSSQSLEENKIELQSLDKTLRKFWEVEEVFTGRQLTEEEKLADHIYDSTTVRLVSGRYSVSLPFKRKVMDFDEMRRIALNRFASLERRLSKNPELFRDYSDCLNEYINLGHMVEVSPELFPGGYYIPHHCVLKDSSTTRLRVVFDASAQDMNSQSLNDYLLNGPRLQSDLLDLLIRFRFYKVAFTADVAKMYRQILMNPNDYKFQLVLWRDDVNKPIKTYALKTVTFGTTSAPYLAVKTLYRLAADERHNFPLGCECLEKGFYVDDCIYGADSVEEAIEVQSQVSEVLKSAGFHLRKWSSSSPKLLEMIPESDRETNTILDFDSKMSVKTLGIQWTPVSDCFSFKIQLGIYEITTKRTVLSDVAKIFDPMGLLSPCIIKAKILIQTLWSNKIGWDEPLPNELQNDWSALKDGLPKLNFIKIPRWFHVSKQSLVEIHGFSDASPMAYAAVVYIKAIDQDDLINVSLVCSKTRVAPLKKISLPRLELMGAVLLSKMIHHIKEEFNLHHAGTYLWADSEIALAWIKDDPHKRTVFVANRITEIQGNTRVSDWHYINTHENPADLGTRGIDPTLLPNLPLWWHGPDFLKNSISDYSDMFRVMNQNILLPDEDNAKEKRTPSIPILQTFLTERRQSFVEVASNTIRFKFEVLNKYSTFSKLIRIVSYCLRFLKKNRKEHSFISPIEYEQSLLSVIRMVQLEVFHEEIEDLQNGTSVNKKSTIYSLHPFISPHDNILRVSGRLQNADHLNFDQKYPFILPRDHIISKLIVRHAHLATFHGTNQETLMLISQRYHIIKCSNLVRATLNRCVKCFRQKCKVQEQLMGMLPKYRVTPNRPFLNCGVDFAGPFEIKKFKGRCKQFEKSYFAIFSCFSTKAVHLEVVSDLSTAGFIAAYRRFISRRGLVLNLHSDNGTNFVGSKSAITRSMLDVQNQWNLEIAAELAEFKTNWHFNPPGAPHFGGLWEAGVKSVKYHLKRVVGQTRLTYEEFETILVQIEAILNSRPLCKSDDGSSLIITPAHFLVQDSLLSFPDNNLENKLSLHDRWVMVQCLIQSFWKLWSNDYLNSLRQRKKWTQTKSSVKVGDVVIIKENNLPPNSWLLGLVVKTHPGSDGLVRVVTLKTKSKELQRPIVKICPLPL